MPCIVTRKRCTNLHGQDYRPGCKCGAPALNYSDTLDDHETSEAPMMTTVFVEVHGDVEDNGYLLFACTLRVVPMVAVFKGVLRVFQGSATERSTWVLCM